MMKVTIDIKSNMDLIQLRRMLLIAMSKKRRIRVTVRMWQNKKPPK